MMTFREAKQLSIVEYLSSLGVSPVRIRQADHWYVSPFRSEKEPSFKVNDKLNLWYDHGAGIGGTIIDLGMNLNQCSANEFLKTLSGGSPTELKQHVKKYNHITQPKIELVEVGDLKNIELLDYLRQRKIQSDIANQYCNEVTFKIGSRQYSAVGFQNKFGGFELRNHWFKGSTSPKDLSLIKNGSIRLAVFEGFFDMLSSCAVPGLKHLPRKADLPGAEFCSVYETRYPFHRRV
jgi:hypothetical protein